MRELKSCDNNSLTITDRMSGSQVILYYRTPTTTERINFTKSQTKRKGNKIQSRIAEARLSAGFTIITGFRKGDFAFDGVAISSKPGEEGYRSDWKNLLYTTASDLLMVLGEQIFEGEQQIPDNIEFEDGGEDLAALPDIPAIAGETGSGVVADAPAAPEVPADPPALADLATAAAEAQGTGDPAPLTSSQTSAT
jgi:hypothetical protein